MPLIADRRFWVFRHLVDERFADHAPALVRATFYALAAEFSGRPEEPLGLCVLLADARERGWYPDAQTYDPVMIYAGYLADGRQVRIAYFDDAVIERV